MLASLLSCDSQNKHAKCVEILRRGEKENNVQMPNIRVANRHRPMYNDHTYTQAHKLLRE